MQRMGRVIGIKPQCIERYKELHAQPWPDIIEQLKQRNIQNFSIFLREPENLLFSYWEYTGTDFEADFARSKEDCLLYTSPSPRDRTRSRMPSSA